MRLRAFAGFGLFALLGAAAADTPAGNWHLVPTEGFEAVQQVVQTHGAVAGLAGAHRTSDGVLEGRFPLEAWRGKRLRLTLHLTKQGEALAYASARINQSGKASLRAAPQKSAAGNGVWQDRFVQDVPRDATDLIVAIRLSGEGSAQLDGIRLEAVGGDVALTRWNAISGNGPWWGCSPEPCADGGFERGR